MHKFKWERYKMALLLGSFAVTGCGMMTSTPVLAIPESTYCTTAKPIYISARDVISDSTARAILEHNLTGQKLCGWGRKDNAQNP